MLTEKPFSELCVLFPFFSYISIEKYCSRKLDALRGLQPRDSLALSCRAGLGR